MEVSDDEVLDYCRYIKCKKRDALYYLTDSHRLEKELILECIADYSGSFSYDELRSVLQHVYPDLYIISVKDPDDTKSHVLKISK